MSKADEEWDENPFEPPKRTDGICPGCDVRGPRGHQCEHNGCTCRICNPVSDEASR